MPIAQRTRKTKPSHVTRKPARTVGGGSEVAKVVVEWANQFDAKLSRLTERQDAFLRSLEPSSARQN